MDTMSYSTEEVFQKLIDLLMIDEDLAKGLKEYAFIPCEDILHMTLEDMQEVAESRGVKSARVTWRRLQNLVAYVESSMDTCEADPRAAIMHATKESLSDF